MVFLGGYKNVFMINPITLVLRRGGAFLLDILIIFGICAPSGYLIQRLFGYSPQTGPAIWFTILWNFSVPSWLYFLWSDRSKKGKTVGKRVFKLKVIHISAFALSQELGTFATHQYIGFVCGNALAFGYFIASALTQGKRTVYDFILGTEIQFENF